MHRARLLRLRQRLRFSEEAFHLVLAGLVGVIGGCVNIALYRAAELAKPLVFADTGGWTELAAGASPWLRLLLPVGGACVAGWILHWSSRVAKLPDTGNILEVVVVGDGRLHLRSALAKTLSSLLTISTGGSIGREGPITHLSATLASRLGMVARWQPYRLRLLVACGAAAGMAAAYNAPVAGAVFAAQIVLGSFSMSLFAPLVFASVVATLVSRSVFGLAPMYIVPTELQPVPVLQLPWFLLLGLLAGALGAVFMRGIRIASAWFEHHFQHRALRLSAGGLLVGMTVVFVPEIWGNGYEPTNGILDGQFALQALIVLLMAKLFATVVTVGTGAVGGVFTPTLFLGAALGGVLGETLHHLGWATEISSSTFTLVGMGCGLAATTHSVLLAVIMVFEISLSHVVFPPLLVACAVATLAARRFYSEDIYTGPLRRRGVILEREAARLGITAQKKVGDLMQQPVRPVSTTAAYRDVVDRFLTSAINFLPVTDAQGRLVGLVALEDLKHHLGDAEELDSVIAFDVMRAPPRCLTPDQRVLDVLPFLLASELRNVPVVDTLRDMKLVGAVNRPEALGLLAEAIGSRSSS
jgi:CIC family chloride channel protein